MEMGVFDSLLKGCRVVATNSVSPPSRGAAPADGVAPRLEHPPASGDAGPPAAAAAYSHPLIADVIWDLKGCSHVKV
ncbi:unnamed protein product [Urochloa humidicola]